MYRHETNAIADAEFLGLQHYAQPTAGEAASGGQARAAAGLGDQLGVTFTATPSASGSLLLGSSREFSGWDTTPCPATIQAILSHAEQYLPDLVHAGGASSPDLTSLPHLASTPTSAHQHQHEHEPASERRHARRASKLGTAAAQNDSPAAEGQCSGSVASSSHRRHQQPAQVQPQGQTADGFQHYVPASTAGVFGKSGTNVKDRQSDDAANGEPQDRYQISTNKTSTIREVELQARVGLRPYVIGGVPLIGPVPGFPRVIVAAGHEGSGLTLGPATAERVLHDLKHSASYIGSCRLDLKSDMQTLILSPAEALKQLTGN